MRSLKFLLIIAILSLPAAAFAAGGHEDLSCAGCHGIHSAKDNKLIFAVPANIKAINPATDQAYSGITALCLGCHQTSDDGGEDILPVSGHISHPFNISKINPKIAQVPSSVLREGVFECVGCHDPHPSNPNYRYLLVDTDKGSKLNQFCSVCHSVKVDPKNVTTQEIFSSMDQRKATVKTLIQ